MAKTAIISVDGHVKGSRAQYREYIPKRHLEAYDEQVKAAEEAGLRDAGNLHAEFAPEVQWDSDLRISNLEGVGVVAEVLFANGQPFQLNRLDDSASSANAELGEVGREVYNRWLADFCAQAPERRRGQLAISFEDIDQAVKEVYWAKENGLGGIRLPGLTRDGKYFFDRDLDPIWAACVETGLPISQHGGNADPNSPTSQGSRGGLFGATPGFGAILMILNENAFFSNRSLWMLIAGGVFDRFPDLRAAWIESQLHLMIPAIAYMDMALDSDNDWMGFAREQSIQRMPGEYFGTNVFIGISPFSPNQHPIEDFVGKDAEGRPLPGFHVGADAGMFGVDYPHFESIFLRNLGEVALLVTTPGVTEADTQKILLENAAKVFDFDLAALQPHIDRVGFELADVRANADDLTREMPEVLKTPGVLTMMTRGTAPATASVSR